jgi:hypothetical protein
MQDIIRDLYICKSITHGTRQSPVQIPRIQIPVNLNNSCTVAAVLVVRKHNAQVFAAQVAALP